MKFPYEGAIDADGHVLESPGLWEKYLDPRDRGRALRVRRHDDGGEYLEIDGAPAKYFVGRGQLGFAGAMRKQGDAGDALREGGYVDAAPFGSGDPRERVALLDREGIEASSSRPPMRARTPMDRLSTFRVVSVKGAGDVDAGIRVVTRRYVAT